MKYCGVPSTERITQLLESYYDQCSSLPSPSSPPSLLSLADFISCFGIKDDCTINCLLPELSTEDQSLLLSQQQCEKRGVHVINEEISCEGNLSESRLVDLASFIFHVSQVDSIVYVLINW